MLAVIPSGPVQAPGPPTSLHTVRGSSLTVSPPWPTCTSLLPSPVQTGWLAASPRKGCPRGCRPRPQTRSVPKTSDSAHFTPDLPAPRTLSFYRYHFNKRGTPPCHQHFPPCAPLQAGPAWGRASRGNGDPWAQSPTEGAGPLRPSSSPWGPAHSRACARPSAVSAARRPEPPRV